MQEPGARGARRILSGRFGAEALARTLADSGHAWCWLDGESPAPDEASVSYFGVTERVLVAAHGREQEFLDQLRDSAPPEDLAPSVSPSASLRDEAPGAFRAGWVTALSYEFGVALLGLDPATDDAAPGFALRLDAVLVLIEDRLELRANTEADIEAWLASFGPLLEADNKPGSRLNASSPESATKGPATKEPVTTEPAATEPQWRRSGADYAAQVAACQRAIAAGDAYVMCLTDSARIEGRFDPVDIYARLRRSGTATRGGVICAGDRALVSASPERFLSVSGREILTHPIKGTRPRSADAARDRALAAELAADPKEQAENLMIVDLMRNDLSRVCDAGSVGVRSFLKVEQHPHVHQLVSTVVGCLTAGRGAVDALEACFPGGSMTGAPKRRVVELLGALEAGPRGLYSGCFGWIDDSGDAELAMTIRGVELRGLSEQNQVALVGAGGGVTADSDPERERAEKDLKAASILTALRAGPA